MSIVPSSRKIPAGVLAILLGQFGVHKFYMGMYRAGTVMAMLWVAGLVLGWLGLGLGQLVMGALGLLGLVEGVIYLTRSDSEFFNTYFVRRKEWF